MPVEAPAAMTAEHGKSSGKKKKRSPSDAPSAKAAGLLKESSVTHTSKKQGEKPAPSAERGNTDKVDADGRKSSKSQEDKTLSDRTLCVVNRPWCQLAIRHSVQKPSTYAQSGDGKVSNLQSEQAPDKDAGAIGVSGIRPSTQPPSMDHLTDFLDVAAISSPKPKKKESKRSYEVKDDGNRGGASGGKPSPEDDRDGPWCTVPSRNKTKPEKGKVHSKSKKNARSYEKKASHPAGNRQPLGKGASARTAKKTGQLPAMNKNPKKTGQTPATNKNPKKTIQASITVQIPSENAEVPALNMHQRSVGTTAKATAVPPPMSYSQAVRPKEQNTTPLATADRFPTAAEQRTDFNHDNPGILNCELELDEGTCIANCTWNPVFDGRNDMGNSIWMGCEQSQWPEPKEPGQGATATTSGEETTALPAGKETTTLPAGQEETALPTGQGVTALPASQGATALPTGQGTTALLAGQGTTALPTGQGATALPASQGATALPTGQDPSALPAGQEETALPTGQGTTAPQSTGVPVQYEKVQSSLGPSGQYLLRGDTTQSRFGPLSPVCSSNMRWLDHMMALDEIQRLRAKLQHQEMITEQLVRRQKLQDSIIQQQMLQNEEQLRQIQLMQRKIMLIQEQASHQNTCPLPRLPHVFSVGNPYHPMLPYQLIPMQGNSNRFMPPQQPVGTNNQDFGEVHGLLMEQEAPGIQAKFAQYRRHG